MTFFTDVKNLFGLNIDKKSERDQKDESGVLSLGLNDDGSAVAVSSSASLAVYLDVDGQIKSEVQAIQKYRDIALYVEVDSAIQDIINEAIPMEADTEVAKLNLDSLPYSDKVKETLQEEFDTVKQLFHFEKVGDQIFRRWYVDGKIYFQIIVDKNNMSDGIQRLIPLDAVKVKKIKEIKKKKTKDTGADVIEDVKEYFIYNENGFVARTGAQVGSGDTSANQGLKISPDAILYCSSGYVDANNGMTLSYLHKAIRPINQLRMLEDATVTYFIARAPERRVFYIDVGNLPKLKAEQYLKDIMNRFRNKMVYDASTGEAKSDKKYASVLEDFFLPRRDGGKGTEISVLPGAQNVQGYLDSLDWFKEKMYDALNVPKSRMQADSGFSLGRTSEITRDELKFQKFIDRLRARFGELLIECLKTQLSLKGIVSSDEWDQVRNHIKVEFQRDNYFTEFKEQDIWNSRFELLTAADNYAQKYVSREWIMKNVLKMADDDIKEMDAQLNSEKNDPRAMGQVMMQITQMDQQNEMQQQQAQQQAEIGAKQADAQIANDKVMTAAQAHAIKNGIAPAQPPMGQQGQQQDSPEYDQNNYQQQ